MLQNGKVEESIWIGKTKPTFCRKEIVFMKYYRVISERADWFSHYFTKASELFTEKERNSKVRNITDFWFEVVNISQKQTKIIDGRRFEIAR